MNADEVVSWLLVRIVGVLQSVEVFTKCGKADDVQSHLGRPMVDLDDRVILNLRIHAVGKSDCLGPKDRVELFNMAEAEGRHDVLALDAVFVTLDDDQSITEDAAEKIYERGGSLEVVAVVDE